MASPDGKYVAYVLHPVNQADGCVLEIQVLANQKDKVVCAVTVQFPEDKADFLLREGPRVIRWAEDSRSVHVLRLGTRIVTLYVPGD